MLFRRAISRVSNRKFTSHYDLHFKNHPNGGPNAPASGKGIYPSAALALYCIYQYGYNMQYAGGKFDKEFVKDI